ncbi:hypothetical protein BJV78DRAFT_1284213 [Lactifluus subvellereus]|nr:hypothetical protein BJV78DRAFT_1284213 [Lactifluus subvellereus]
MEGLCPAPCAVAHIFRLPPETELDTELASKEVPVPLGSEDWLYKAEVIVTQNCTDGTSEKHPPLRITYRIHRIWSAASTVKGVTADNSLATVRIAYARDWISAVRGMPIEKLCRDPTGYACGSRSLQPPPLPGSVVPTIVSA